MITRSGGVLAIAACAVLAAGTFTAAPDVRPSPARPHPQQESALVSEVAATSPARLHRAWMLEILDLDLDGAVRAYAEIAADKRPSNLARWVAAARLAELQRLGIATSMPLDLADAPQPLRTAFAEAGTPLDIEPVVRRLSGDPDKVLLEIAAKPAILPALRTVVGDAESWFVDQVGPSSLDRWRQRRAEMNDRAQFTDRVYAALILRDELQGRRTQADEKRSIYFMLWQAPKAAPDPKVELERFRRNMEALLLEREWTRDYQRLHGQLQTKVEALAAEDPAAAMDFVRRLPQYGERLLAPIPEEDR